MNYNSEEYRKVREIVVNLIIKKLEETYQDYIQNQEGFKEIPSFFKNYLYSPANKEERDRVLVELYHKLKTIVGQDLVENIQKLIELVKLSDELDFEITEEILKDQAHTKKRLNHTTYNINLQAIEKIIHKRDQYEKRKRQILLVCETLNFFFNLSKLPLVKLVMAPIKVAASLVGAEILIETMEEGYRISKNIKDMKPFINDFYKREMEYLESIKLKYTKSN
ncbi:MAG: hypothetical protein NZ853_06805 [Leptospiraceae bacterium]|nr:hypothetical protein [Leptospiraceae bacterium]MDW7975857.1 hypothetical protein [Leptospiraceae bacterium]